MPISPEEDGRPSSNIKNGSSYSLFMQLYTKQLQQHILDKTNEKCIGFKYKIVTQDELLNYQGIIYAMGMIRMPEMAHYWSCSETLFGNLLVKATMTKARFKEIHRCLSFDIDWILDTICEILKNCWYPSNICTVDECIILFKGRFRGRQHVRGKPHATGLKLFVICDSYGMPIHFWLYRGKGHALNMSDTTVSYVMDLAKKLPNRDTRKYTIFADQFYGSKKLANELQEHGFDYILSCQVNHPSEIFANHLHDNLQKQEDVSFLVSEDGKSCAMSFYDSGKCNFLASVGSTSIPPEELERKTKHNNQKRPRPGIVRTYNLEMGSVDKFDAKLNIYHYRCKHRSWKRCMFFATMKMLVTSSLTIFQHFNPAKKPQQQLHHLTAIIYGLTNRGVQRRDSYTLHHFPLYKSKSKRCEFCSQEGMNSNTKYQCSGCGKYCHPKCWLYLHYPELKCKH